MAQNRRMSYVLTRDGSVGFKMELYDGKNWVVQMVRTVAGSLAEFRRNHPNATIKQQPVQSAAEEQGDLSELLSVTVRDLPEALKSVDSIDGLVGLIEEDDRETAQRLYRQRAAELYRNRMRGDDSDSGTEGETGGPSEEGTEPS